MAEPWYNCPMVTRFRAWLTQAIKNVTDISKEPILAMTLAVEFFTVYREASAGGLGVEDALAAGVIAVLGLLGRQLVYPAAKVDAATAAVKNEEEPLGEPFIPQGG